MSVFVRYRLSISCRPKSDVVGRMFLQELIACLVQSVSVARLCDETVLPLRLLNVTVSSKRCDFAMLGCDVLL